MSSQPPYVARRLRGAVLGSAALVAALAGCTHGKAASADKVEKSLAVLEKEEQVPKLVARGKAFARAGDMTRAEQYFAAALERGADPDEVLPLLLRVCVAERRYRVAIDYAETYLRKKPADTKLRFVVGTLYASIGEVDEARRHLEATLEAAPDNANAHFALAVLYRDEVTDPVRAHEHFEAYLRLEPGGAHADEARGSLLKAVP